jgi:hypothetical protein
LKPSESLEPGQISPAPSPGVVFTVGTRRPPHSPRMRELDYHLARTAVLDPRTKRLMYTGKQRPHRSRRQKRGWKRGNETPGPGAYSPKLNLVPRSPRPTFGKAPQRVPEKHEVVDADPWENTTIGRAKLVSSMGYQPTSDVRSAPSVSFGTASRDQAMLASLPASFANARFGMESPGPIYNPQTGRTEAMKRYGIRMQAKIANKSSLASEKDGQGRPSTAAAMSATRVTQRGTKTRRPITSFGMSNRPQLFMGDASNPGPGSYKVDSPRRPSTTPGRARSPRATSFGNSTREQQKRIVAISGTDLYGRDSPGPGSYFPTQEVLDLAEHATRRMGPRFTVACGSTFGSMFEKTEKVAAREQKAESALVNGFATEKETLRLTMREPGPGTYQTPTLTSTMFRSKVGKMKSAPLVSFSVSPRFGDVNSFSMNGK